MVDELNASTQALGAELTAGAQLPPDAELARSLVSSSCLRESPAAFLPRTVVRCTRLARS